MARILSVSSSFLYPRSNILFLFLLFLLLNIFHVLCPFMCLYIVSVARCLFYARKNRVICQLSLSIENFHFRQNYIEVWHMLERINQYRNLRTVDLRSTFNCLFYLLRRFKFLMRLYKNIHFHFGNYSLLFWKKLL